MSDVVVLTDSQWVVMMKLMRGERVTYIVPATRRWLVDRGYISTTRLPKGRHQIEITDLGREVMSTAVRARRS